ncbi:MAG: hypothetical protein LBQ35_08570 [Spirochaetaceae bacterium]|jgi:hypothetical protein|nr:hypothetical protein [Spirochaetaceae bacterium]
MKNITLAIDEETLTLGREYAQKNNISFNKLVRNLIIETVKSSSKNWLNETIELMNQSDGSSKGKNGQGKNYIVAKIFFDTNISVYTLDTNNINKQKRAQNIFIQVSEKEKPVISTQVLQEFYYASTAKTKADKILVKNILHKFPLR